MLSIRVIFWLMVIFFALIGYLRGWPKEVIALTGLIASIAALSQFGYQMVALVGAVTGDTNLGADLMAVRRQQFWIQAIFHVAIAFFSYQGVPRLASTVSGGRLGDRARAGVEKKVLGAVIGALNGYLVIGGLWSFLEYQLTPTGYIPLAPGESYAFDMSIMTRPIAEASMLIDYLPLGFLSPTWWLLLFFGAFFLVIIALI